MKSPMAELARDNPAMYARLAQRIAAVVTESLRQDGARSTASEAKRRTEICVEYSQMLRGSGYSWSVERIGAALPLALRTRLDGGKWEPPKRAIWTPEDAQLVRPGLKISYPC